MRLGGIDTILGSTGHGGRKAAEQLVRELRAGRSTGIAPDGPGGPARVLKRGVFHIAAQTGVPIVPLRFTLSRAWQLPTWDRKRLPQPFSTITVRFGKPISVPEDSFDEAMSAAADRSVGRRVCSPSASIGAPVCKPETADDPHDLFVPFAP